jgi:hypothetical protein
MNNKEYLLNKIQILLKQIESHTNHDFLSCRNDIISTLTICESYLLSDMEKENGAQKSSL